MHHVSLALSLLLGYGATSTPALVPLFGICCVLTGYWFAQWLERDTREWLDVRRDTRVRKYLEQSRN